jgi:TonB family protein
MPTLKQNEIFANRYQLIKKLGVGGYSEVWLAKDNKAGGMEVALKIYSPEKGLDDKGLETFSKEFSLVFNLNHLNLLKPTYFDDYDGSPYLVMPYCKNASMADKIGNISEKELASFIHQAASALAYLHEQQPPIIHQDIKPDNFLIDNSGHFLLADFGISSKIRKTLTKTMGEKNSSGTMAYMPPEKFSREKQTIKAGDIFSLGITLYELLTTELAFGEHGGIALISGAEIPDLPKQYSSELNDITRSCMAKDPWDRPTAETLVEIAKSYELTGKWDITKLPIAKKEVYEEPIIIPKEPEKPRARETVQIPENASDNKKEQPATKPPFDSFGKPLLYVGIAIALFFTIIYFVNNKVPSAEEKAAAEQKIEDSIAQAEQQRINDSIAEAELAYNDSITVVELLKKNEINNYEISPEYNGGENARIKYLQESIKYPDFARERGIQGTVYTTFIVEKDGKLSQIRILRGIGGGCDEEAIRVVKAMPNWNPGKEKGKPVRVQFNMPIKYTLSN